MDLQELILQQITPEIIKEFKNNLQEEKLQKFIIESLTPELKAAFQQEASSQEFKAEIINSVKENVLNLARDFLSNYSLSIKNIQVYSGETLVNETTDLRHKQFEELLKVTMPGIFVFIKGPAGCGKTKCIQQIAQALGKDFYPIPSPQNVQDLIGFIDANGKYVETDFFRVFTKGGIASIEEIDISDPIALKVCNNAFGDGFCRFPIGKQYAHKDFICFVNANTFGTGRSIEYVGNTRLDAATLNRFFIVIMDYDKELERLLFPDDEILEVFWRLRESAEKNNIKAIFSTRGISICYNLRHKENALSDEEIIKGAIIRGLNVDDINALSKNLKINSQENSFFEAFLKVRNEMRNN
mgnify:CR=1 FL=1